MTSHEKSLVTKKKKHQKFFQKKKKIEFFLKTAKKATHVAAFGGGFRIGSDISPLISSHLNCKPQRQPNTKAIHVAAFGGGLRIGSDIPPLISSHLSCKPHRQPNTFNVLFYSFSLITQKLRHFYLDDVWFFEILIKN